MVNYFEVDSLTLQEELAKLEDIYKDFLSQNLTLDMTRGKPCPEQLDLSIGIMNCLDDNDYKASDGTDCRNYGLLDGIPEAKELFSKMLGVSSNEIIIGDSSSLNIMYNIITGALIRGVYGSAAPWGKLPSVKFLCPSPGYDRHFKICEHLNIEMITVDMKDDGPDMDMVEELVSQDEAVKGIWCTPKYSNPQGITYSDEVVDRFAGLKPKAKDFRIFWDNAYAVHHFTEKPDHLKNILEACKNARNPDMVFIFTSTSKITFPGAGVAMVAASENNINFMKNQLMYQTIGPNKINQLRHIRFLKSIENIDGHMKKQAKIIKPKFDTVFNILDREIGGKDIAWWSKPNGGYFLSLDVLDGCAKSVVKMAGDAGVKLTCAGATYPYGKDPRDRNIRIAPSYPALLELEKAIEILCVCIKIISIRKLLSLRALPHPAIFWPLL